MEIRKFQSSDLAQVLNLIERSDNTNRSADSWGGNSLTGMLAFDDSQNLIGAIPLEPRKFLLGNAEIIPVVWVTAAHVDEQYRSKGIGSKMDMQIRKDFYPEAQALFVYRDDETSDAYRWYKKLGYEILVPFYSFKKAVKTFDIKETLASEMVNFDTKLAEGQEAAMLKCFEKSLSSFGGVPKREPGYWSQKINFHYYKNHYRSYSVLNFKHTTGELRGYAVLGETSFKDGIDRLDILDFSWTEGTNHFSEFLSTIAEIAAKRSLAEVRIQVSKDEPYYNWLKENGFIERWSSFIMGVLFDPITYLKSKVEIIAVENRVFIEVTTPNLGSVRIGDIKSSNGYSFKLSDSDFTRILLRKLSFKDAVTNSIITVSNHNSIVEKMLESKFINTQWIFRQLDYI